MLEKKRMRIVTMIKNKRRGEREQWLWRSRAAAVANTNSGSGEHEQWRIRMLVVENLSATTASVENMSATCLFSLFRGF